MMSSKIKLFLHLGHSNLLMGGIFATEQDFIFFFNQSSFFSKLSLWASQEIYHIFNVYDKTSET